MLRISNEIDGKLYDLVPEIYVCEGCDLMDKCYGAYPEKINSIFNGCSVCDTLRGIWKEVCDEVRSSKNRRH